MKKNDKKGAFKKNETIFDPDIYEEEEHHIQFNIFIDSESNTCQIMKNL